MNHKIRISMAFAVGVAVCASAPFRSSAQQTPTTHHHYVVVDAGTLGGPESIVYEPGVRSLNNRGTLSSCADTPNLDFNNPQNPAFGYPDGIIDPYIQHSFQSKRGEIEDLGTFPGGTSSCSQWISDSGWIAGSATNGKIDPVAGFPAINAALWRNGQLLNLGTFGGDESLAWSVNDQGQVVGFATNTIPDQFAGAVSFGYSATQTHAFLWQNGRMHDLGTLGGPDSDALLINERGQIAGISITTIDPATQQPTVDPFLWENGKMIDLGTLGGTSGTPDVINNKGQVVGISNLAGDQTWHPFLWSNGVLRDLGTNGGSFGEARWINDGGDAAGWATLTGDFVGHATLWKEGKIVDLGATTDLPCSYANGINNLGQVLGALQHCPDVIAGREALLWEKGDLVNLNTLIPLGSEIVLIQAITANDRGEIVAEGRLLNGDLRAVLLIPCDANHPNLANCDYRLVDATLAVQVLPAQITQSLASSSAKSSPAELMARFQSLTGNRHRRFGAVSPK
jgi:probable HAF family extracellular repeat protein